MTLNYMVTSPCILRVSVGSCRPLETQKIIMSEIGIHPSEMTHYISRDGDYLFTIA